MSDGSDGTGVGSGERYKVVRHGRDLIAMTHPDFGLPRDSRKQRIVADDLTVCSAVFTRRRAFHFTAKGIARQLHPVTDTQHGQSQFKESWVAARRAELELLAQLKKEKKMSRMKEVLAVDIHVSAVKKDNISSTAYSNYNIGLQFR